MASSRTSIGNDDATRAAPREARRLRVGFIMLFLAHLCACPQHLHAQAKPSDYVFRGKFSEDYPGGMNKAKIDLTDGPMNLLKIKAFNALSIKDSAFVENENGTWLVSSVDSKVEISPNETQNAILMGKTCNLVLWSAIDSRIQKWFEETSPADILKDVSTLYESLPERKGKVKEEFKKRLTWPIESGEITLDENQVKIYRSVVGENEDLPKKKGVKLTVVNKSGKTVHVRRWVLNEGESRDITRGVGEDAMSEIDVSFDDGSSEKVGIQGDTVTILPAASLELRNLNDVPIEVEWTFKEKSGMITIANQTTSPSVKLPRGAGIVKLEARPTPKNDEYNPWNGTCTAKLGEKQTIEIALEKKPKPQPTLAVKNTMSFAVDVTINSGGTVVASRRSLQAGAEHPFAALPVGKTLEVVFTPSVDGYAEQRQNVGPLDWGKTEPLTISLTQKARPTLTVKNTMDFAVDVRIDLAGAEVSSRRLQTGEAAPFVDLPVGKALEVVFTPSVDGYAEQRKNVGPLDWGKTTSLTISLTQKAKPTLTVKNTMSFAVDVTINSGGTVVASRRSLQAGAEHPFADLPADKALEVVFTPSVDGYAEQRQNVGPLDWGKTTSLTISLTQKAKPTLTVKNAMDFAVDVRIDIAGAMVSSRRLQAGAEAAFADLPTGKALEVVFTPLVDGYAEQRKNVGPLNWGKPVSLTISLTPKTKPTLAVKNTMSFPVEVNVPSANGGVTTRSIGAKTDTTFDIPVNTVFSVDFIPPSGQYQATKQSFGPFGWGKTASLEIKLERKVNLEDQVAEALTGSLDNPSEQQIKEWNPETDEGMIQLLAAGYKFVGPVKEMQASSDYTPLGIIVERRFSQILDKLKSVESEGLQKRASSLADKIPDSSGDAMLVTFKGWLKNDPEGDLQRTMDKSMKRINNKTP